MSLTKSEWKVASDPANRGFLSCTCTVEQTTEENDAYTLKTPKALNPSKPWQLIVSFDDPPDGSALPIDLYVGWDEDFKITGDGATVSADYGVKYKQILDDCKAGATLCFNMDPTSTIADVVTIAAVGSGLKVKPPIAPFYAFNLNGGSTLSATTVMWKIIQKQ